MKILKYQLMRECNQGTEEQPNIVQTFHDCVIRCSDENLEANYAMAKKEAYMGVVTVENEFVYATAPHNIEAGEYVTIEGVLYLATENIPNGEPIIVGQNAIQTSVEEQLYAMKGE